MRISDGVQTCALPIWLALEDRIDGRDRLDLELARDEAIRIDVDLRQHDALVGIVGGDLFEHGGELLARPAPFGPEIQDDEAGHRRLDDVAPERLDGFLFLRVQAQCGHGMRSEEHTSELQSLMRISYADF